MDGVVGAGFSGLVQDASVDVSRSAPSCLLCDEFLQSRVEVGDAMADVRALYRFGPGLRPCSQSSNGGVCSFVREFRGDLVFDYPVCYVVRLIVVFYAGV